MILQIARFVLTSILIAGCCCCPLPGAWLGADQPPSVVILFADDAGYADFGFQPNCRDEMRGLTPAIDSIAAAGVRFSNAYVSGAVCSPSRAGLMTGRYQQRFGHETNIPPGYMAGGLSLQETFFARHLQDLGYSTGLVGKWHLGYPDDYHPNARGFAWFYGLLQGSRSYFPIEDPSPHRVFLENRQPTDEGGYTTDRIGDAAVRFIRQQDDGQPFFLFVSFTAPHGPLQAKPEHLNQLQSIEPARRRKYAGLIRSLDENVGKILNAVEESNRADNTLVIFTNDNGGQTQTGANNFPLRGRKGQLWEGGIRVPMAIRWPGVIAAGSVIEDPVSTLDLAPTLIHIAGGTLNAQLQLDGIDLAPRLRGSVGNLPQRTLFWRTQGSSGPIALRDGNWKLVFNRGAEQPGPFLFDLAADIGEERDLAGENPGQVERLRGQLVPWESELIEPLWGPGAQAKPSDTDPISMQFDHHVHLLSSRLIGDWSATGMQFSRPAAAYSDPLQIRDALGVSRAIAVSMAHLYTMESFAELESVRDAESECVAAENDFIAECVAKDNQHWVGFFSVNPLRDYSRREMDRCRQKPELVGLKLHLPACGVDLTNREHLQAMQQTIAWCHEHSIPILVHPFYGGEPPEAIDRFWQLFRPYPQLQLIVAHVGGSGGFGETQAAILAGFQDLVASDKKWEQAPVYFDLSGAVLVEETDGTPATPDEQCRRLAAAMREVGLHRFLPATDYPVFSADQVIPVLKEKLKLHDEEIRQVLNNRAPVLQPQSE